MKKSCFVRRIDELGRIVVPIEIRQTLDIKEKDPLEIFLKDDGVFIKKNQKSCVFCNATINLKPFSEKNICKNCINNLKKGGYLDE